MVTHICIIFLSLFIDDTSAQLIQCENGNCYCPSTSTAEICVLECNNDESCKGLTLTCRNGASCEVRCNGKQSCVDTIIDSNNADNLIVICSSTNSCTNHMDIICGNGDCQLNCDKSDACINLTYRTIIKAQKQASSTISDIRANSTAFIILLAAVCCIIFIVSSATHLCCYYKRIQGVQKTVTTQTQSKSIETPSSVPTSVTNKHSPYFGMVYSNSINTSPPANTANPLSYSYRNSQVENDSNNVNDKSVDINIDSGLEDIKSSCKSEIVSTNFFMLPLSTKRQVFETCVDNETISV
eukprot:187541_1